MGHNGPRRAQRGPPLALLMMWIFSGMAPGLPDADSAIATFDSIRRANLWA
jgi:hypothetical protein